MKFTLLPRATSSCPSALRGLLQNTALLLSRLHFLWKGDAPPQTSNLLQKARAHLLSSLSRHWEESSWWNMQCAAVSSKVVGQGQTAGLLSRDVNDVICRSHLVYTWQPPKTSCVLQRWHHKQGSITRILDGETILKSKSRQATCPCLHDIPHPPPVLHSSLVLFF